MIVPTPYGLRVLLLAGFAAASLAGAAAAQPQERRTFDIPAADLGRTLTELAQQSRTEILFDASLVRGKRAPAVRGSYTTTEALEAALRSSGLRVRTSPTGALVVEAPRPQADAAAANAESPSVSELVITGTNVRGVERIAAPIVTFTREDLDRTGYETVEAVLASLPSNLSEISPAGAVGIGVSRIANSNTDGTSGVSLRGLGPDATLVLVNGKRRAGGISGNVVDISAIPLSAVERIDVVTGGRSAIYGSDAVAGVVNVTLRRRFEGAESQVSYGQANEGGERRQLSQIVGIGDSDKGLVVAADYFETQPLNVVETGLAARTASGITPLRFTLIPRVVRTSLLASGSIKVTPDVEIYGDASHTFRKTKSSLAYTVGPTFVVQDTVTSSRQSDIALGAKWARGPWTIDASGSASKADIVNRAFNPLLGGSDLQSEVRSLMLVADGPLPTMLGVQPRAALGAELRKESLDGRNLRTGLVTNDLSREIRSVFGELVLPLFGDDERSAPLEISLAGRYDDYSRIGGSFTPQVGAIFRPNGWLTARGAYSEAFRAPDLFTLQFGNGLAVQSVNDPASPTGRSTVLFNSGGNPDLQPETAKTWTLGLDVEPTPWAKVSLSYFRVRYQNRIDEPAIALDRQQVLVRAANYPGLINRSPGGPFVQSLVGEADFFSNFGTDVAFNPATQNVLGVFPNLVYFDNRRANIAQESASGIDLDAMARFGRWRASLRATYFLELDRSTTPLSPAVSQLERHGKPVDFRARLGLGREGEVVSASAYLNYIDGYLDKIANPARSISPWATLDASVRLAGDGTDIAALKGVTATFSADNLLDARPPRFANHIFGLGYDPANSNPYGRYLSVRLAKRW